MDSFRRILALVLSFYLLLGPGADRALAALDAETTTNPTNSGHTPSGSGTPSSGLESFKTDLATGGASFGIPIEVPPGTAGMQPSVTLGYSSGAGKGWVGFGWSLEMGRISRRTQRGVPTYTASDEFQLDQTRLVKGTTSGQYYTEIDSFVRIEAPPTANDPWVVTSKDGKKLYFGSTDNGRIKDPGDPTHIFAWLLDKVEDTFGNFLLVSYQDGGDGANRYLRSITYTYHSGSPESGGLVGGSASERRLDFCLESNDPVDDACDPTTLLSRSDPAINYQSGFRVQTTRRLKSIRTYFGNSLIRSYDLSYLEPGQPTTGSSATSRLASVQVVGSDNDTALPPMTFTYTPGAVGYGTCQDDWANPSDFLDDHFFPVRTQTSGGESETAVMDLNGDGVPERVTSADNTNWNLWEVILGGTGYQPSFSTWPFRTGGNPDNFNHLRDTTTGKVRAEVIDMDGNGLPDRVAQDMSDDTQWKVYWNDDGTEFAAWDPVQGPWPNPSYQSQHKYSAIRDPNFLKTEIEADVIDLTGDGLPDRVIQDPVDQFKWKVYKNRGRNGSPVGFDPSYIPWTHRTDKTMNGIQERNSNGIQADLIDLNGDGLPDRVLVVHSDRYWHVWFNTGYGFENVERLWDNPSYLVENSYEFIRTIDGNKFRAELEDINGDGLVDRITEGATGATFRVYLNTGAGFSTTAIPWTNPSSELEPRLSEGNSTTADLVDIDGDGLIDRVMYNGVQGNWQVCPYPESKPDLLARVENGIGGSVEISYQASTQYLKLVGTGRASPNLPFPVQTVLEVRRKDGVGNPADADQLTTYHYAGGSYNAASREFRGFGTVTTVEGLATDLVLTKTETVFHQDDRLKGQVAESKVYHVEGTNPDVQLTEVVNDFLLPTDPDYVAIIAAGRGSNIQVALLKRTRAEVFGSDPAHDVMTGVQFRYDTFGNVLEQLEEGVTTQTYAQDGDERKTCTTYVDGQSAYRVGFPSTISFMGADVACGTQKLSEAVFLYDGTSDVNGFWITRKSWLLGTPHPADPYVITNRTSDAYGNVKTIQPVAGDGLNRTTTIFFDGETADCPGGPLATSTHTFPCRIQNPKGQIQDAFYDAGLGAALKQIDLNGHATLMTYDVLGRPTSARFQPNGGAEAVLREYSYPVVPGEDPEPEGYWGTVAGTGAQNVQMIDYAVAPTVSERELGIESRTFFDGMGRATTVRTDGDDQKPVDAQMAYDSWGRIKTRFVPYFGVVGQNPSAPTGPGTTVAYDALGRVTQVQHAAGNCTLSFYDGLDTTVELRETCASATVTQRRGTTRDAYGRVREVREYLASDDTPNTTTPYRTTYEYDARDNLTAVKDACENDPGLTGCIAGQTHVTTIQYDELSRKVQAVDPDMGTWLYTYDDVGNLKTQTDNKGDTITFTYDDLDRVTLKDYAYALQQNIIFTYDGAGDPNATNGTGRLTAVTDAAGNVKYGYDPRGNLTRFIRDYPSAGKRFEYAYTYDNLGRPVTVTYPKRANGGSSGPSIGTLTYNYADGDGNQTPFLQQILGDAAWPVTEVVKQGTQYDALGNLKEYVDGSNLKTKLTHDPVSGQLEENQVVPVAGGAAVFHQRYTYDPTTKFINHVENVGNKITDQYYSGSGSVPGYDALGRLRVSLGPWQPYSLGVNACNEYDPLGNILVKDRVDTFPTVGKNLSYTDATNPTQPHTVRQLSFQDGSISRSYSYDANGNMSLRLTTGAHWETRSFVWDRDNRLIRMVVNGQLVRNHLYDYTGERVYGLAGSSGQALYMPTRDFEWSSSHQQANVFVYLGSTRVAVFGMSFTPEVIPAGGWVRIEQFLDAAGSVAFGLWPFLLMLMGLGLLRWWTLPDRAPMPILARRASVGLLIVVFLHATSRPAHAIPIPPYAGSVNITLYYHADYKGSTSVVTAQNQVIAQGIDYWPFGGLRANLINGYFLIDVRHKFTDQELDAAGLYYYGGRWYDPEVGRFISPDPFVQEPLNPQSLNRYSYVVNNPTNYVDPSGYIFGAIVSAIVHIAVQSAIHAAVRAGVEALNALITRGDVGKAAIRGAIEGGIDSVSNNIGVNVGGGKGRAISFAGRIVGKASAEAATGGKSDDIRKAAVSGGISALIQAAATRAATGYSIEKEDMDEMWGGIFGTAYGIVKGLNEMGKGVRTADPSEVARGIKSLAWVVSQPRSGAYTGGDWPGTPDSAPIVSSTDTKLENASRWHDWFFARHKGSAAQFGWIRRAWAGPGRELGPYGQSIRLAGTAFFGTAGSLQLAGESLPWP